MLYPRTPVAPISMRVERQGDEQMKASVLFGAGWEDDSLEVLWRDAERAFCRLWREVLTARGTRSYPSFPAPSIRRSRASIVSSANTNSRTTSLPIGRCGRWSSCASAAGRCWSLSTPEVSPWHRLIGQPMEVGRFLRLARGAICRTRPAPRTRTHSQRHQPSQRDRGLRGRARVAYRLWHRLTPAA